MQDEIVASLASQLDVELITNEARRAERTPNPDRPLTGCRFERFEGPLRLGGAPCPAPSPRRPPLAGEAVTEGLSREVEIDPRHAALLLIDVQNYTANRDGGVYRGLVPREIDKRYGYFFATLRESAIPNMQRLQKKE